MPDGSNFPDWLRTEQGYELVRTLRKIGEIDLDHLTDRTQSVSIKRNFVYGVFDNYKNK